MRASSKRRLGLASVAGALALLAYGLLVWRFDFLCDDAYINFRYSRNLALGRGLRFNPGESPPVEACNFLWAALLGIAERLGGSAPSWSKVGTIGSGLALMVWTTVTARRCFASSAPATAGILLFLATLPPFAVWSTSGMETMPSALLIFGVFERLLGDPDRPRGVQAGVLGGLATLMRPDGMLFTALVLGVALAMAALRHRPALGRACAVAASIFLFTLAAATLGRWIYFEDVVANTVHAKSDLDAATLTSGLYYLTSLLLTLPGLALVLMLTPIGALGRDAREIGLPAFLVCLGVLAYTVLVGGDFLTMGRFALAALPFAALMLAASLSMFEQRGWSPVISLGACCLVSALSLPAAYDLHLIPEHVRARFQFRWLGVDYESEYATWMIQKTRAEEWSREGRALAHFTKLGDSMIRGPIGAVGYHTELFIYDIYGLIDRDVSQRPAPRGRAMPGHSRKVDPEYFFDRNPTFLAAELSRVGDPRQHLVVERATLEYDNAELVEHHPLRGLDDFEAEDVLDLHRLVDWNEALDPLLDLFEVAQGIDLRQPAAAELELNERLPPAGTRAEELRRLVGALIEGGLDLGARRPYTGQRRERRDPGFALMLWSHAGKAVPRRDWRGSLNLCLPLSGKPAAKGRTESWVVSRPGSFFVSEAGADRVAILSLIPVKRETGK